MSPLDEPNYIVDVASAQSQVTLGALIEIVLAISVFGIAVMFFPILKKQNEGMALGYVGIRIVEGMLVVAAATSALLVLTLSQDYGRSGGAGARPLGDLLLATREWTYLIGTMLVFSLSALVLYTLLYRAALIPAWLSLWGLAGALLLAVVALLRIFGREFSGTTETLLAAPIGLNEMVLALWLIIKGFDVSRLERKPAELPELVGA